MPHFRFASLGALVALVGLASVAAAQPPVASVGVGSSARGIRHPTIITRPGSYVVERSLGGVGAGTVIEIRANDVSLDLGGFTLFGPGDRTGTGVAVVGAANVRVHNGHLQGFGVGVRAEGGTNLVVEGLQIDGRDLGGTPPSVEVGVLLVDTRGARVVDNVVTDTFLGVFVRGEGSAGNRIADNVLTGGDHGELGICYNPAPGQSTGGPHGDFVYLNVVTRWRRGLALSADSTGNVVRENSVAYFDVAIEEATPGSNVIEENSTIQIAP